MATTFPMAIDSFINPIAGDYQNSATVDHHVQHANANDAIEAVQSVIFGIRNDLAASKIVPGATSWSLRNSADTTDNLKVLDSGALILVGSNAAAVGTGHTITTGNGTAGAAKGGDLTITIGTGTLSGNASNPAIGTARHGEIDFILPIVAPSTPYTNSSYANGYYPHVTINASGLGIGGSCYKGTPFRVSWLDTDPDYQVECGFNANVSLTASNAMLIGSLASGVNLFGPGANSVDVKSTDGETHIYSSGTPTHTLVKGGYQKLEFAEYSGTTPQTKGTTPTAAGAITAYGNASEIVHLGSGTVTTGAAHYAHAVISTGQNAINDGNFTTLILYDALLSLAGTHATGSVIPTALGLYVRSPNIGSTSTAVVNTIFGLQVDAQFNTKNHSSATAGQTLAAGAAKFTVSTQSVTAASTIINYGIYLTGQGGSASGGGAVTNYVLYSDSTLQAHFSGTVDVNALSIVPTAKTSGNGFPQAFLFTGAAHTGLTPSSGAEFNLNFARTITYDSSGTGIASVYSLQVQAPTYAAGAATVITKTATVRITGAPVAGSNMTLTQTAALQIDAGAIALAAGVNFLLDTVTGTKIGTVGGAAGQKIGFFNQTPIVQPLLATAAGATADNIITALQNLGLVRQS